MGKQTIALCMIVKDEADVIERCFDSVKDFVDYYVICDTGSTDGTPELVKNYLQKHGLEGEVHHHAWVDFGHNRSLAFDLGEGKSDYILTLDADEVIAPYADDEPNLFSKITELPELTADRIYITTVLGSSRYQRHQLFKNGLNWKWLQPVHEVCNSDEIQSQATLDDLCVFASTQDGGRSKDGKKFLRDACLFEKFLIDNPTNERSWFYLAQTYGDAGNYKRALEATEEYLKLAWWDQEIYIAKLRKARWNLNLTDSIEECTTDYLEAYSVIPTRLEALFDLVRYYSRKDKWHQAMLFGKAGLGVEYPGKETLFIERDIYTWQFKDLVSVACFYAGDQELGVKLVLELLDSPHLPEDQRERVEGNLKQFEVKEL